MVGERGDILKKQRKTGLLLNNMVDNINVETLKDIDLIIIMGGTNDYTNNKIIGTKEDNDCLLILNI